MKSNLILGLMIFASWGLRGMEEGESSGNDSMNDMVHISYEEAQQVTQGNNEMPMTLLSLCQLFGEEEIRKMQGELTKIDAVQGKYHGLSIKNGTFADIKKGLHLYHIFNKEINVQQDGYYSIDLEQLNAFLEETSAVKPEIRAHLRSYKKILQAPFVKITGLPEGVKEKIFTENLMKMLSNVQEVTDKGIALDANALVSCLCLNNNNVRRSATNEELYSKSGIEPFSVLVGAGLAVGSYAGYKALYHLKNSH